MEAKASDITGKHMMCLWHFRWSDSPVSFLALFVFALERSVQSFVAERHMMARARSLVIRLQVLCRDLWLKATRWQVCA